MYAELIGTCIAHDQIGAKCRAKGPQLVARSEYAKYSVTQTFNAIKMPRRNPSQAMASRYTTSCQLFYSAGLT